ncbi:MAG: hypothetical protein K0S23_3379 [Fluviicola sp.]|uniref:hypothetical protein n=1 Tax=Fluviicola sp. TaxID=1917219 RepID=UPI00261DAE3A|nr:hypothetical protein [Fluviicola sp.]MDF3029072.1 hypothetical protein [Fluviicola sp.]
MKKILALTILSLAVLSCKKDKIEPAEPQPSNPSYAHISTTGSYWVYDWYEVDSTGNETLIPAWKDTIRIVGDSTINGKIFQHYKGTQWNSPIEYYMRDSSGYVVNTNGKISYSYVSNPMLVSAHNDGYIHQNNYIGEKQTINTAFGSKLASTTYTEVSMVDGTPVNSCGDLSVRLYNYYVSGLGCTGIETAYISQFQALCSKKRSRLSAYYIAP